MIVSDFVPAVILKATGQPFEGEAGDEDWNKVLAIANRYIDSWVAEPGVDWDSTYTVTDIGTVTATDTFDLDDSIYRVSNDAGDPIVIRHANSDRWTEYKLISANQLHRHRIGNYVARFGRQLKFNKVFAPTDPQFGGTIQVPGNVKPSYLANSNDVIPVDEPYWLVLMSAAEWARTDLTQAQNYPLLIAEANNVMQAMKQANRPSVQSIVKHPVARGAEW